MRLQFWAADTLRFSVTGPEPHRFLNRAAAAGVRLRRVRWQRDGYAATVSGTDRRAAPAPADGRSPRAAEPPDDAGQGAPAACGDAAFSVSWLFPPRTRLVSPVYAVRCAI